MKVVFITYHYLNGNGGGVFASRAYINALAEIAGEVTLLFPMKEGAEPEGLHPKVRKIAVWDKRNKLQKGLALLLGQSNRFRKLEQYIGEDRFDMVILDSCMVVHGVIDYFKRQGTKVVTIHHNYQYEYFRDNTSGLLRPATLFWVKRDEREAVKKSDLNLTLTEADRQLLSMHYGTGQETIEVLGSFEFETKSHPIYPDVAKPVFLITGDLGAKQTVDSTLLWLHDYYPLLMELCPDAILVLAGKNPSPELLRKAKEYNIQIIPSPESMAPILAEAKYYICPVSLGGGRKLRVMDGLSAGLPILCHVVSARGYEEFVEKGIVLPYEDKASFKEQLQHLLDLRISKSEAIELYESVFSFESGKNRLANILKSHQNNRLLIFHPLIAPYRVDFFNSLSAAFESKICLSNPDNNPFADSKIENQLSFRPVYLDQIGKMGKRSFFKGYWRILEEFNPNLVFVGEYGMGALQALLHKWLRRKNYRIVSICDDSFDMLSGGSDYGFIHRWGRSILAPRMDEIILVEPMAVKWYRDHFKKGYYFPIIRDDEKQRATLKQLLPASKKLMEQNHLTDKHVFLYVGRFVDLKNIKTLINSFASLDRKDNALVLIGSGPEEQALKSLALAKDDHQIIFPGWLDGDELYAWYNVADYFVLPSYTECFGAVTNEALLAGCYSLVSNRAGSRCLIEHGVNGFTFNPASEEELSVLMQEAIRCFPFKRPLEEVKQNLMNVRYSEAIHHLIKHLKEL